MFANVLPDTFDALWPRQLGRLAYTNLRGLDHIPQSRLQEVPKVLMKDSSVSEIVSDNDEQRWVACLR